MNLSSYVIMLMLSYSWTIQAQNNNFFITDFGGVSDGKTDNKQAFARAWKKACETNGGTISVPKGVFYVSYGDFEGPCNGQTSFDIDGTLIASSSDDLLGRDSWLIFYKVDGLTFSGSGTLDGNGASVWSRCKNSGNCKNRPCTFKLMHVRNVEVKGLSLVRSKMFHVMIHESENVKFKDVHITAPDDSPNTDGIHISHSTNIDILDSKIGTGDDCVSIGDGSHNVNISGVYCGPGHGLSIGSLGKYTGEEDVTGITVRNCTLNRTDNGLRIKTWGPSKSSNTVSNVTYADIILISADNPILIDQNYCPSGSCGNRGDSSVGIRGLKYVNVRGSSSSENSVNIVCSKTTPCRGINLIGVDITYKGKPTTATCSNAVGVGFQNSGNVVSSRCR